MSFIDDDDDDTDDDRLTSIRKLRRPMSIFNYPTPAGANSSSNNALYGRYQGMRSVSSLQKPAGVLQHPQRRSVSLLNGYPDHLKYRLESDRPSSRTGRKSSLGAGGGEDTAADMFNELDLIKERMQRLNAGTSSGRATPQPINHTATVGVATTPVTSSANINFASSSTTVPSDRLFQRRSSLTNTQPGSDYYRSARTATMPLALPVMSPNSPLARAPMANPIDFVPPDRTPTSLSQHHLQSVLARLGDCVDIDSLLIDRACSDLLRVYPTTTTPQQREALDQVCLSMANFVIKMLDDGQKQQNDFECEQQQEQQLQDQQQQQQQQHHHHHQQQQQLQDHQHQQHQQQHQQQQQQQLQQQQQQSHFSLQPLQRDFYTTPQPNPLRGDSLEIPDSGQYKDYHRPNSSLKLDTSDPHLPRRQQQHSRRSRANSLLFHKDTFVARNKSFSGIFPEIRARQN